MPSTFPICVPSLPDTQSEPDARGVALDRVGVSGLRHPVRFDGGDGRIADTAAVWSAWAALEASRRGQHLSRFPEWIAAAAQCLDLPRVPALLDNLRARMEAPSVAGFETAFTLFIDRRAPVSGREAPVPYDIRVWGQKEAGRPPLVRLAARVPITSLCPCSKAISEHGAHNQRGTLDITIELTRPEKHAVAPAEIIDSAENAASSPVYALLKRVDERAVTQKAYETPAFVEDLTRNAMLAWKSDPRVRAVRVLAATQESIHPHDAFAECSFVRA